MNLRSTRVPLSEREVCFVPAKSGFRQLRSIVSEMYGPPSDCKGKVQREKVCVNVSGLWVEICSPGLDEIRRVPVLRNPSAV